ncbi:MAG: SprT family zinc-dependent metalloprotease [Cyanobacteria bacterium J06598_3]
MSQLELFSTRETKKAGASTPVLPDYKVRESKRAKHVSIKISVQGEVEVVVPPRFDRNQLPGILEKRREWIIKTRSRLLSAAESTCDDWQVEKPETIVFRWQSTALGTLGDRSHGDSTPKQAVPNATGFGKSSPKKAKDTENLDVWTVAYQPGAGNKTLCVPTLGNRLMLKGNVEQPENCQAVLRKWLAHRAHRDITPWLRQLGFDLDLPCRRISVRGQKTRWASCSSQKDISLNYKLLFLPRPLVHYVLVHELCHTVHMNHSARFWDLVEQKQPNYRQWKAELKQGWRYVPRWVETS